MRICLPFIFMAMFVFSFYAFADYNCELFNIDKVVNPARAKQYEQFCSPESRKKSCQTPVETARKKYSIAQKVLRPALSNHRDGIDKVWKPASEKLVTQKEKHAELMQKVELAKPKIADLDTIDRIEKLEQDINKQLKKMAEPYSLAKVNSKTTTEGVPAVSCPKGTILKNEPKRIICVDMLDGKKESRPLWYRHVFVRRGFHQFEVVAETVFPEYGVAISTSSQILPPGAITEEQRLDSYGLIAGRTFASNDELKDAFNMRWDDFAYKYVNKLCAPFYNESNWSISTSPAKDLEDTNTTPSKKAAKEAQTAK